MQATDYPTLKKSRPHRFVPVLFLLSLALSTGACKSNSDQLAFYEGGQITRGDYRNYLLLRGKALSGSHLSANSQAKDLGELALNQATLEFLKKKGETRKPEFKEAMKGLDYWVNFYFLALKYREELNEKPLDMVQTQILFKKFPKHYFSFALTSERQENYVGREAKIFETNKAGLLSAPESGKEVGKITRRHVAEILSKSAKTSTVDGVSAPWYRVRLYKRGGGKKEAGPSGYVFGGYLRLNTDDATREKVRAETIAAAKKEIAKMKNMSDEDVRNYIAANTDETAARLNGGIKPWQAMILAEIGFPGSEDLKKLKKLKTGEFLPEPQSIGSGLQIIRLRDRQEVEMDDLESLYEDHFSEMIELAGAYSQKSKDKDLTKRAKGIMRGKPAKQAAAYASSLKKRIMKGSVRLLLEEYESKKKYSYNPEADVNDPEALVVETPDQKFRVKDLKGLHSTLMPYRPWNPDNKRRQSFMRNFAPLVVFRDALDPAKLTGEEKARYERTLNYYRSLRAKEYLEKVFIDKEKIPVSTAEKKQYYAKNSKFFKQKNNPKKKQSFAQAEPKIIKIIRHNKYLKQKDKLLKQIKKDFKIKVITDALRNGEV